MLYEDAEQISGKSRVQEVATLNRAVGLLNRRGGGGSRCKCQFLKGFFLH